MTNKLVVIINSLKVPKIKKILLYEMKFLVPNYSCLQNPWLGGYRPRSPFALSSTVFVEPSPPNKIPGYATDMHHPISKSKEKVNKGWINTDSRSPQATKFCKVGPNICVPSIWKLHHVSLPTRRILRWVLDFQTLKLVYFRTNFITIYFGPTHVIKRHNVLTTYSWKPEAHPLSYIVDMICDIIYDMIYLLTAVGLTPGGSITVHTYTQTVHRTTQAIHVTTQFTNWEVCGPCPVLACHTLASALWLRKVLGKISVRVAEDCQLVRWKQNIQNRAYITVRIYKHKNKNT